MILITTQDNSKHRGNANYTNHGRSNPDAHLYTEDVTDDQMNSDHDGSNGDSTDDFVDPRSS